MFCKVSLSNSLISVWQEINKSEACKDATYQVQICPNNASGLQRQATHTFFVFTSCTHSKSSKVLNNFDFILFPMCQDQKLNINWRIIETCCVLILYSLSISQWRWKFLISLSFVQMLLDFCNVRWCLQKSRLKIQLTL